MLPVTVVVTEVVVILDKSVSALALRPVTITVEVPPVASTTFLLCSVAAVDVNFTVSASVVSAVPCNTPLNVMSFVTVILVTTAVPVIFVRSTASS